MLRAKLVVQSVKSFKVDRLTKKTAGDTAMLKEMMAKRLAITSVVFMLCCVRRRGESVSRVVLSVERSV